MIKKILVFMIISIVVTMAQKPQLNIIGDAKLLDNEIVGRRDANGHYCAAIKIISNLKDLAYQSNNGIVGDVDRKPGIDIVYLSTNERVLEIFHIDHEPMKIIFSEQGIKLKEKQIWQLEISGKEKLTNIPINIITKPENSMIFIDDQKMGTGTTFQVTKGKHKLQITKDGYKSIDQDIDVTETSNLFNLTLVEVEPVMITIKSNPQDATIYIDDVEEGQTNKQLFKFPGNYKLNLRKNKYESIEETIIVSEQGNNEFSYNLGKTVAILTINTTPMDAEIFINGSKKDNRKLEVAPGRYRIEVKKSGYNSVSRTITIEKGLDQTQTFDLEQLTGKLQLVVEPMETKVILKQGNQQIDSWTGSKYLSDIGVGNYTLELSATDYNDQTKSITISENKTTNVGMKLVKITAPARVNIADSGNQQSFGTCRDIDGNVYKTVKIGNQIWMAENLKVTHYRNGDEIPNVKDNEVWEKNNSGAMCAYENSVYYVIMYGNLYNWNAVNDPREIAPAGWHVPSEEEWNQLETYLGTKAEDALHLDWRGTDSGKKLKAKSGWEKNGNGSDIYGFVAFPGGHRHYEGKFDGLGEEAVFWTSQESNMMSAWYRAIGSDNSAIKRDGVFKEFAFSVRCVKD